MAVDLSEVSNLSARILSEVEQAVIGKHTLLERIIASIFVPGGHLLLEDFPGMAKTLIAKSFAKVLGLNFKRIQFTPDLLPGDITGGYIYNRKENRFELRRGPLFANILLADEINRASPKTQSALLEAMQECQVTIEGETMQLPKPFIVIATQNPIEYEGTFPLPEAQLDRFLLKLSVGYPTEDEEQAILKSRRERQEDEFNLACVTDAKQLLEIHEAIEKVHVDAAIDAYIIELVAQTRRQHKIAVGVSPRGSLALLKLSRVWAALQGRDFVLPDDVKQFYKPALRHRLVLEPNLWMQSGAADELLDSIMAKVTVPVI